MTEKLQLRKKSLDVETATNLEEEDNEEEQYERDSLDYDPEQINIVTKEPTIDILLKRINEEALDLAPDFQRHANLWENDTKSRLIESIIIRIPLPAFYVDATNEDKWLVVDGLQRLTAIKQFVSDKTLKLSGLEYLKDIEGKTYDEISRKYQRRIEETQVTVYLIEKGTPNEVKFNIFKRINTGGLSLTNQEMRHALNPGKAIKLLAKIADSEEFIQATKLGKNRKKRMDDREFVLGFLAFMLTSYKDYQDGKRDVFFNEAMAKINKLDDAEIYSLDNKFRKAMIDAMEIFGDDAFRKIYKKKKNKQPVNKAMFEGWSVSISNLSNLEIKMLKKRKQLLIDKFSDRLEKDKRFEASVSQAAKDIKYRFETINELIQEVLS
ncbi:MAG: DUF262 domain-containing protein [Hormoscilla sp.]